MSTYMQRPLGLGAAKLRPGTARPQQVSSLPDARKAPPAHLAVLRAIDLERRARFVRGEADASRRA